MCVKKDTNEKDRRREETDKRSVVANPKKKKQCEIPMDPISTTITTQSPPPLTISPCTTTSDMLLLGQNV